LATHLCSLTSVHCPPLQIHSDIAAGFIKADVMRPEDFLRLGSEVRAGAMWAAPATV
jgi:hypothetical protein